MNRLYPPPSKSNLDLSPSKSKLYLCMYFVLENGNEFRRWYLIDPAGVNLGSCSEEETDVFGKKRKFQSDEFEEERIFLPRQQELKIPDNIPESATFVAAESKIYALGGKKSIEIEGYFDRHNTNEVYVYDTAAKDKDNAVWKPLRSMLTARSGPGVVALDGKLYVMGSDRINIDGYWSHGPWSEVYDIHNNCWTVLGEYAPCNYPRSTNYLTAECILVVPKDRSITPDDVMVVHFYQSSTTYFFCPKLKRWNIVVLPIEFEYSSKKCVVAVEQILFMASPSCLCAYDLVNDPDNAPNIESTFAKYKCPGFPRPKAKMIKGLEDDYPSVTATGVEFFHLGNMDFYLVWPSLRQGDGSENTIHCLRFRVDKDDWHASVLNHDRYPVPDVHARCHLEQCLQVMYVDS